VALPGVVVHQELVDAEAAVRIAHASSRPREPRSSCSLPLHELLSQVPADEADHVARVEVRPARSRPAII
jgi:hypothetical protein